MALFLDKKVLAFEPIQRNLRCLYRNISLNAFTDFEIFQLALAEIPGIEPIYGNGTDASLIEGWANCPKNHRQYIPVSTLDIVLGKRLEGKKVLYLVDVEGSELSLIKGESLQLSLSPSPSWIVEITNKHHPDQRSRDSNYLETFEIFWRENCHSYLANNDLQTISKEDIRRVISNNVKNWKSHNYFFTKT